MQASQVAVHWLSHSIAVGSSWTRDWIHVPCIGRQTFNNWTTKDTLLRNFPSYVHHGSVSQFSHSVVSDSLGPHGLQHARLPCPSPTPRVYSNSSPLSRWCHPTISSSVIPFSSHLQSFLSSGSFPMNQLFTSGGQSIRASASSISPANEYSGLISFRMDWLDLLAVQGTLKSLLQHHSQNHQFFGAELSL